MPSYQSLIVQFPLNIFLHPVNWSAPKCGISALWGALALRRGNVDTEAKPTIIYYFLFWLPYFLAKQYCIFIPHKSLEQLAVLLNVTVLISLTAVNSINLTPSTTPPSTLHASSLCKPYSTAQCLSIHQFCPPQLVWTLASHIRTHRK